MSQPLPVVFSDYIVFVDETGDHGMTNINRDFPLFGLAFCVLKKSDYLENVVPALRRLKFVTFGHDVALSVLRPGQPNRAFDILRPKLWQDADGRVDNCGLKLFPPKNEGPPGSPSSPLPNG